MTLHHIPADDLRVGDVIVHDGDTTTVRELDRSASPREPASTGAGLRAGLDRRSINRPPERLQPGHKGNSRPSLGA